MRSKRTVNKSVLIFRSKTNNFLVTMCIISDRMAGTLETTYRTMSNLNTRKQSWPYSRFGHDWNQQILLHLNHFQCRNNPRTLFLGNCCKVTALTNNFGASYIMTIQGSGFLDLAININQSDFLKYEIWDVNGRKTSQLESTLQKKNEYF